MNKSIEIKRFTNLLSLSLCNNCMCMTKTVEVKMKACGKCRCLKAELKRKPTTKRKDRGSGK